MRSSTAIGRIAGIYINKRSLIYLIIVLLVGAMAGIIMAHDGTPYTGQDDRPYVATTIVRGGMDGATAISGRVDARIPLQAAAAASGRIVRVTAMIGDRVRSGQVLAVIDDRMAAARVAQAHHEAARTTAIAAERATAAGRARGLAESGAMSEAEAQAAAAEARASQNAAASAAAALESARADKALYVVRAPGDGVIISRQADLGSVVAQGQPLFGIDSGVGGIIIAHVPQEQAGRLASGMAATFRSPSGDGTAVVEALTPRIESGGYVQARLAIRSGNVPNGAIVTLQPVANDHRGTSGDMRIPLSAIVMSAGDGRFVYRIGSDRRIHRVPIRWLGISGDDARIGGAVEPGDRIVAGGGAFLRDGASVRLAIPAV